MRALASPHIFHGTVERCFPGARRRNLWRIDSLKGQLYLLLLSTEAPDLTAAVQQFGFPDDSSPWETKDYTPLLERIQPGDTWHFRLTANPTRSCCKEPGKRGKVMAHITPDHQKEWLKQRGEANGFSLQDDDFSVVYSGWRFFTKQSPSHFRLSLLAVTYEGVLTITDKTLFCKALTEGIGRGKAYGMGMLTVAGSRSRET